MARRKHFRPNFQTQLNIKRTHTNVGCGSGKNRIVSTQTTGGQTRRQKNAFPVRNSLLRQNTRNSTPEYIPGPDGSLSRNPFLRRKRMKTDLCVHTIRFVVRNRSGGRSAGGEYGWIALLTIILRY